MPHCLHLRIENSIARITLDRPAVGNAIDRTMVRALMDAAIECDENDAIRCVVLTGTGRMFCAGGDIAEFSAAGEGLSAYVKDITDHLHAAVARLARMKRPLVTAVNGAAAGAGFSLAILGDIAIAAHSATFTMAYSGIGLTPDGGASWLLPRLVGLRKAQEIMLLNPRISAADALEMGLVTRVVADHELEEAALAVAADLAGSAVGAHGAGRRLLAGSFGASLETQLELESRAIIAQAGTPEAREGISAFLEKRAPDFMKASSRQRPSATVAGRT